MHYMTTFCRDQFYTLGILQIYEPWTKAFLPTGIYYYTLNKRNNLQIYFT